MAALRRSGWRIGLDLDNTLVTYDELFRNAARGRTLVPTDFAGGKREIRDAVRLLPNGEMEWRRLQAHVYGPAMLDATLAPGAREFMEAAHAQGVSMLIVSHKTERPASDSQGVNLREAAMAWLRLNRIVGPRAIPEDGVYFESTRSEKIARIALLRCTHFIDDLEEVFNDPAFPASVEKILIAQTEVVPSGPYRRFASFHELSNELFGS